MRGLHVTGLSLYLAGSLTRCGHTEWEWAALMNSESPVKIGKFKGGTHIIRGSTVIGWATLTIPGVKLF